MESFEKDLQASQPADCITLIQQSDVVGGGARQGPSEKASSQFRELCRPVCWSDYDPTLPSPTSEPGENQPPPGFSQQAPVLSGQDIYLMSRCKPPHLILPTGIVLWRMKRGRQPNKDVHSHVIAIHNTLFVRRDEMRKLCAHDFVFYFRCRCLAEIKRVQVCSVKSEGFPRS